MKKPSQASVVCQSWNRPAVIRIGPSWSSQNFAAMQYTAGDEVLFSGVHGDPLPVDDQRVAAWRHEHVFVVVVSMRRGCRGFTAGPERQLAPVRPVEYVAFDSWG